MSKKLLTIAIAAVSLALICLLLYSIERTAWLFDQFETWTEAAYAAAIVVELAAVALIVGASALAHLDKSARAWANRALLAVLSVGALANLSAGYLRGGAAVLDAFGGDTSAYAVAASLWAVTNLAVPGLILCLSKLLERLIAAVGRRRTFLTQRRTLIVRLLHSLRAARADLARSAAVSAQTGQALAQRDAQIAQLNQEVARLTSMLADSCADLEEARADLAQQVDATVRSGATLTQQDQQLSQLQATIARQDQEIARLKEEAAQAPTAGDLDTTAIARALREPRQIDWRTIERLLGIAQATLRGRVERTNGHLVEG